MTQQRSLTTVLLAVAAGVVAACSAAGLVLVGGLGGSISAGGTTAATSSAVSLHIDAIPEHARHLAWWVIRAGSICREITPPMVAGQVEQESGWNPRAVAPNPQDAGGDAMGIAQFQQATWDEWGLDINGNGEDSPFDPEDAIWAQGRLMCANVNWAGHQVAADRLTGDVVDLALAAYFCGRQCVLDAGGVPGGGLAGEYPGQVRARAVRYSLAALPDEGGWTLPLPVGSYRLVSGFGERWGRLHAGVDLAASVGTPILAAAGGTVLDAGCTSPTCDTPGSLAMPGCGWRVNLHHGGGLVTRYCHAVALVVAPGQLVQAGETLGWVGSTGNSSGPHLHFEVHRDAPPATNATAVDPVPFLQAAGVPL